MLSHMFYNSKLIGSRKHTSDSESESESTTESTNSDKYYMPEDTYSSFLLNSDAMFGRAVDLIRVLTIMVYLMEKFNVPDDQWALSTF